MTERIRPHITKVGGWWWAWRGRTSIAAVVGPCATHAEVVAELDALRPTLEVCS